MSGFKVPAAILLLLPWCVVAQEDGEFSVNIAVPNGQASDIYLIDDRSGEETLINPMTSQTPRKPNTIVFLEPTENDPAVELVEGVTALVGGLRLYRQSTNGPTWEDPDSPGFPVTIFDENSGIPGPIRPQAMAASADRLFVASCDNQGNSPCELWVLERRNDCPVVLPGGFREPVMLDSNVCARDGNGACVSSMPNVQETQIAAADVDNANLSLTAGDLLLLGKKALIRYKAADIDAALSAGGGLCTAGGEIISDTLVGPQNTNLGIVQGNSNAAWTGFDFVTGQTELFLLANNNGDIRFLDTVAGDFGVNFVSGIGADTNRIDASRDADARAAVYVSQTQRDRALKFLIGTDGNGNTVAVDEVGLPTNDPLAPYPVMGSLSAPADIASSSVAVVDASTCLFSFGSGCNATGLVNHLLPDGSTAVGSLVEKVAVGQDPRSCSATGPRLSIADLDDTFSDVDILAKHCGQSVIAFVESFAPGIQVDASVVENTILGDVLGDHLDCWEPGDALPAPVPTAQSIGLYGPTPGIDADIVEYLDGDPELIELTSSCGSDRLKSKGLSIFGVNFVYAADTDFDAEVSEKIAATDATFDLSECDRNIFSNRQCKSGRSAVEKKLRSLSNQWRTGKIDKALQSLDALYFLVSDPANAPLYNKVSNFAGDLEGRITNTKFTILTKIVCPVDPADPACSVRLPWSTQQ